MSMRLTVADMQNSRAAAALNVCPTSERFYQWLNEAEDLMLAQGRWWGSIQEAQFCSTDLCLVWPREVAAIEQVAICGQPVAIENGWYGFTRLLANLKQCNGCSGSFNSNSTCGDRFGQCSCGHVQMRLKEGTAASFATTRGSNKVIRSYPTNSLDVGKKIRYQGYDKNGIWVRTIIDGTMQDGEQVVLQLPFVDTVTVWGDGAPMAVQKEVTAQRVLVYSYDTAAAVEKALAVYQPSETNPSYRVSYMPQGRNRGGCCGNVTEDGSSRITVTALVSLQHVDVSTPADWLVLQNRSAYKAAMMAVKAWEQGDVAMGNYYFYGSESAPKNARGPLRVVNRGGAIPLLQAELRKMNSDRVNGFIYTDETNKLVNTMLGFR